MFKFITGASIQAKLQKVLAGRKDPRIEEPKPIKKKYIEKWRRPDYVPKVEEKIVESLDDNSFEIEEYRHMIKNRCFLCEAKIKNDWQNYLVRGNTCIPCNTRINNKLRHRC